VILRDNARRHCAQTVTLFSDHNFLRGAAHPPYSPYLALSDFWVFDYLETALQGSSFDEPHELVSGIQELLRRVGPKALDAVFQEWMIRLQKCIDGNGEYAADVQIEMLNSFF
jgi:histone-lysine N-methyltransferase SETMAR